jgi:hypothetical protein
MRTTALSIVFTLALAAGFAPAEAGAQSDGLGGWIRDTQAHRIAGYTSYALALTTVSLGAIGYIIAVTR